MATYSQLKQISNQLAKDLVRLELETLKVKDGDIFKLRNRVISGREYKETILTIKDKNNFIGRKIECRMTQLAKPVKEGPTFHKTKQVNIDPNALVVFGS